MTIFILLLVVLVNFILQSTILPYMPILGVVPNISLLVVITISLYKGKLYGGIIGIIIGLIQDILFSPIIGLNAFIFFFAGYLIGLIENKLIKDNIIIPILLSIIGTLYYNFTYYIFMFFLSHEIEFLSFAKDVLLIETIYNSVLIVPIYIIFSKIFTVPQIRFGSK